MPFQQPRPRTFEWSFSEAASLRASVDMPKERHLSTDNIIFKFHNKLQKIDTNKHILFQN